MRFAISEESERVREKVLAFSVSILSFVSALLMSHSHSPSNSLLDYTYAKCSTRSRGGSACSPDLPVCCGTGSRRVPLVSRPFGCPCGVVTSEEAACWEVNDLLNLLYYHRVRVADK